MNIETFIVNSVTVSGNRFLFVLKLLKPKDKLCYDSEIEYFTLKGEVSKSIHSGKLLLGSEIRHSTLKGSRLRLD